MPQASRLPDEGEQLPGEGLVRRVEHAACGHRAAAAPRGTAVEVDRDAARAGTSGTDGIRFGMFSLTTRYAAALRLHPHRRFAPAEQHAAERAQVGVLPQHVERAAGVPVAQQLEERDAEEPVAGRRVAVSCAWKTSR